MEKLAGTEQRETTTVSQIADFCHYASLQYTCSVMH